QGCFNDMDMLIVGMHGKGNVAVTGLNDEEYKTHFSVWSFFGSPLMIGCDVRDMNDFTRELLTNPRLIRINQDIACRPPFIAVHTEKDENNVYVRLLSDNEIAIMFTNLSDEDNIGTWLAFEDIGLPASSGKALALTDAFTGEDAGVFKEYKSERVKPHDCALYIAKIVDAE
ncbi:MAG: glycoside hydrolase family 27 protein, partial [Clostridia bacterium]|nr:glycoside hydrolase family 27 protein [Clostridia bacterium]